MPPIVILLVETENANYLIFVVNAFVRLCKMQNEIYSLPLKQIQTVIPFSGNHHFLQIYANFAAIPMLKMFSKYTICTLCWQVLLAHTLTLKPASNLMKRKKKEVQRK